MQITYFILKRFLYTFQIKKKKTIFTKIFHNPFTFSSLVY